MLSWNYRFAFRSHFQNKNCYVAIAPFDVRLSESDDYTYAKHVVHPDISVICNRNNLTPNGCLGAPTLIVEVLSPSTALKDRNEKFKLYEQFHVQEYWIVDPLYKTVEVFGLEDGFLKKKRRLEKMTRLHLSYLRIFLSKRSDYFFNKNEKGRQ
ncbi:hypothetical protein LR68_01585 [Anoxybacillus sp. BCO1]|nr:hypothetical protein LR68_01585 [Anoxybacillus sp. BCO1]